MELEKKKKGTEQCLWLREAEQGKKKKSMVNNFSSLIANTL